MRLSGWALPLLASLVSCTHGAAAPERRFAPLVDHHLHLLSPASADVRLGGDPLPDALARLVRDRELKWNKAPELAGLYAENSTFYGAGKRWMTDPKEIAASLAQGFTGPYRLRPVSARIDGSTAQISGFMQEGDGTDVPFGFFHLELGKDAEGMWRITSETELFPGPTPEPPLTAEQTVRMLDAVGIQRGVVVSNAYYFALHPEQAPDEYDKVRAENDWTAQQVASTRGRLVAFCSFNPLRDYALTELERCAASGKFRGLKMHLHGARLDFQEPRQVETLRRVMEAANRHRLPMIIHVQSTETYGREDAEVFLRQHIAAAPDIPIQIAHLWGGGRLTVPVLDVYANAVASGDPVAKNLSFDISGAWLFSTPEQMQEIVARIRRIGLDRILYASDAPPSEAWHKFRTLLPLTEAEFQTIASNVAPYMRER